MPSFQCRNNSYNRLNDIRMSTDSECEYDENLDVIDLHQVQLANILRLNIECFEKLLDCLPLSDLISIGQTCRRLHQAVGHIFRQNYSGVKVYCKTDQIRIGRCRADQFAQFVRNIFIYHDENFKYFLKIQSRFLLLRQIELKRIKINASQIKCIARILSKVEFLRLDWCDIEGNFDRNVLSACNNLKHLCISSDPVGSIIIGTDNNWLNHKYPKLEHLELTLNGHFQIDELKEFLELNPNIRSLSIYSDFFWQNRDWMLTANVELNDLGIYANRDKLVSFGRFCHFLNELHARRFYRRLFYYDHCDQNLIDALTALNAPMKLRILNREKVHLAALTNIEELYCEGSDQIVDLLEMANNLMKLECIHFYIAHLSHMSLLIGRCAQLKKIIVYQFYENPCNIVIDLFALNREREQLHGAQICTLYVEEEVYLATKWATQTTNFDLVRLMRVDSREWDNNSSVWFRTAYYN